MKSMQRDSCGSQRDLAMYRHRASGTNLKVLDFVSNIARAKALQRYLLLTEARSPCCASVSEHSAKDLGSGIKHWALSNRRIWTTR